MRCVEHDVEFVVGRLDEYGKPVRRCPACVDRDRLLIRGLMDACKKYGRDFKQRPVVMVIEGAQ